MFTEEQLNAACQFRMDEGFNAARNPNAVCPYKENTLNADYWTQGYRDGCDVIAQERFKREEYAREKAARKAAKVARTKANRIERGQLQSRKARGK